MKQNSGRQRGTLMHLKNLVRDTSVPNNDPKNNVKATEDFLSKVLTAYLVVAAKEVKKECVIPLNVEELSELVIERYVRLLSVPTGTDTSDGVLTYSSEVITLCLLWDTFHDAIREGDGKRVMLIWKFLLLVFDATNRVNYRKEAVILLAQYHFIFSDSS